MSEKPCILFVDDEEKVLKSIVRHFLDEDYEIYTAPSGKEGLALLERISAEVVVSDFRMPEMNGGEFLREVSQRWPDTVRIVLSGYADISAVITAINEGAIFKFISKPWQEHELKDAVKEGLEKYHIDVQMRALAEQALSTSRLLFSEASGDYSEIHKRNLELEHQVKSLKIFKHAFLSASVPILVFDGMGELIEANGNGYLILSSASEAGSEIIPQNLREDISKILDGIERVDGCYSFNGAQPCKYQGTLLPMHEDSVLRGVVVSLWCCQKAE